MKSRCRKLAPPAFRDQVFTQLGICVLGIGLVLIEAVAAESYRAVDLGTLGGPYGQAMAIDNGQVVGYSTTSTGETYCFSWTAEGGMMDLGALGGNYCEANSVDDGMVVGIASTGADVPWDAFVWTEAEGVVDLDTLGGTSIEAEAVSNGQVVGVAYTADDAEIHAFSWTQAGGMVDLAPFIGTNYNQPFAVDNGQVVGGAYNINNGQIGPPNFAFSWTAAGGAVNLGTLGGGSSRARAVSNGQVVGTSNTASTNTSHAFSWTAGGGMVDLGALGGNFSEALAVSNGQVVGDSTTSSGNTHAFSWTQAGGIVDLGTLGGTDSHARAVENGRVVGWSRTSSGELHAFSWTQAGGMVDLGTLGGTYSHAEAINNGQIVGASRTIGDAELRATLWTPLSCDIQSGGTYCGTACLPAPRTCRAAQRSKLVVKHRASDSDDRLVWKWSKGASTSQAEFSDPTATSDYSLCIYAGTSSTLIGQSIIPASASAWSVIGAKGYRYTDAEATHGGVAIAILKGSDQGKSKVLIKGEGAALPDMVLPAGDPITVQLVNGDNGLCWGAEYSGADLRRNIPGQLKARSRVSSQSP